MGHHSKTSPGTLQKFLFAQSICILLSALVLGYFSGRTGLLLVLFGGGVAVLNAVGTAFAWPRILEKKDVALSVSIIVSKFALSIGAFYWLMRRVSALQILDKAEVQAQIFGSPSGMYLAFAFGLASVVPAALVVAIGEMSATDTGEDTKP